MTMTSLRSVCATSFPEFQSQNSAAYDQWRKVNVGALSDVERNMHALILRNSQGDRDVARQVEQKTSEQLSNIVVQEMKGGEPRDFELQCRLFPKVLKAMAMETHFTAELKVMRDHPIKFARP
jgi:hypothetical protein